MPELGDLFAVWSPNEIQSYADSVARGYRALQLDIARKNVLDASQSALWNDLYSSFINFYEDIGFFSRGSIATVRTAERYAEELGFWRKTYKSRGGTLTGGDVAVPKDDDNYSTLRTVAVCTAVGLASVAAIYVVGKLK
jgi:hypothetical protein